MKEQEIKVEAAKNSGGVAAESERQLTGLAGIGEEVSRCEVEWDRPKGGFCKPHQCDLLAGHKGNHVCDCGWTRRFMKRDQPD